MANIRQKIENEILESIEAKKLLCAKEALNIEKASLLIIESLKKGGKLVSFGNGGSAADSQHITAELVGRFKAERKALAAVALTTNTSSITAIANDYSYDEIFARQLEAIGNKGDVALGISTSGNSKNVIAAMAKARSIGMKTIALIGGDGGRLKGECDISIIVPSRSTPRIQESHLLVCHVLCALIEEAFLK
jgi:D-sedoheptulose 7-phosphate isomerase